MSALAARISELTLVNENLTKTIKELQDSNDRLTRKVRKYEEAIKAYETEVHELQLDVNHADNECETQKMKLKFATHEKNMALLEKQWMNLRHKCILQGVFEVSTIHSNQIPFDDELTESVLDTFSHAANNGLQTTFNKPGLHGRVHDDEVRQITSSLSSLHFIAVSAIEGKLINVIDFMFNREVFLRSLWKGSTSIDCGINVMQEIQELQLDVEHADKEAHIHQQHTICTRHERDVLRLENSYMDSYMCYVMSELGSKIAENSRSIRHLYHDESMKMIDRITSWSESVTKYILSNAMAALEQKFSIFLGTIHTTTECYLLQFHCIMEKVEMKNNHLLHQLEDSVHFLKHCRQDTFSQSLKVDEFLSIEAHDYHLTRILHVGQLFMNSIDRKMKTFMLAQEYVYECASSDTVQIPNHLTYCVSYVFELVNIRDVYMDKKYRYCEAAFSQLPILAMSFWHQRYYAQYQFFTELVSYWQLLLSSFSPPSDFVPLRRTWYENFLEQEVVRLRTSMHDENETFRRCNGRSPERRGSNFRTAIKIAPSLLETGEPFSLRTDSTFARRSFLSLDTTPKKLGSPRISPQRVSNSLVAPRPHFADVTNRCKLISPRKR